MNRVMDSRPVTRNIFSKFSSSQCSTPCLEALVFSMRDSCGVREKEPACGKNMPQAEHQRTYFWVSAISCSNSAGISLANCSRTGAVLSYSSLRCSGVSIVISMPLALNASQAFFSSFTDSARCHTVASFAASVMICCCSGVRLSHFFLFISSHILTVCSWISSKLI